MLITNLNVGAWGRIFDDPMVANATADRLLHRSVVFNITGDSYRLRRRAQAALPSERGPRLAPSGQAPPLTSAGAPPPVRSEGGERGGSASHATTTLSGSVLYRFN